VAEIEIAPRERGAGYEFVDATKGGSIPKEYIPAVEQGVRSALDTGVLGGYPVVDVSATLLDGQYHPVDSSEIAFRNAGSIAMKDALERADPILLEPIMKLEISAPEEFSSNVIGDVNGRRGQILGMEVRGNLQIIRATVPLAQSFGYATAVRSLTQISLLSKSWKRQSVPARRSPGPFRSRHISRSSRLSGPRSLTRTRANSLRFARHLRRSTR
jgi:elongation factor G